VAADVTVLKGVRHRQPLHHRHALARDARRARPQPRVRQPRDGARAGRGSQQSR
jgi:hypothetical protein